MSANELRNEIMSMDFNDQRQVMTAMEHLTDVLLDMERRLEVLDNGKADRPREPQELL